MHQILRLMMVDKLIHRGISSVDNLNNQNSCGVGVIFCLVLRMTPPPVGREPQVYVSHRSIPRLVQRCKTVVVDASYFSDLVVCYFAIVDFVFFFVLLSFFVFIFIIYIIVVFVICFLCCRGLSFQFVTLRFLDVFPFPSSVIGVRRLSIVPFSRWWAYGRSVTV